MSAKLREKHYTSLLGNEGGVDISIGRSKKERRGLSWDSEDKSS